MEVLKTGGLGMLVLVLMVVQTTLACQCERTDLSLEGAYCHRLHDQNQRTALIRAEVCHKEFDDGFAEHLIVMQEVYLEPLFFENTPWSIMPPGPTSGYGPSCLTIPRSGWTMLLTSRENRGAACGIPQDLHVGNTYVMEIIYYGALWDITSCAYHKLEGDVTPAERQVLRNFKNKRNVPMCPTSLPPTRRPFPVWRGGGPFFT